MEIRPRNAPKPSPYFRVAKEFARRADNAASFGKWEESETYMDKAVKYAEMAAAKTAPIIQAPRFLAGFIVGVVFGSVGALILVALT